MFETIHPFESVTVNVYVPACKPVAVDPLPPDGDQLYVYGAVPPVTVAFAVPLFPLKQLTFVYVAVTANVEG